MTKTHRTAFIRTLFSVTIALASVILFSRTVKAEAIVEINATNFPDENFRSYISENFDDNDNGYIEDFEMPSAYYIDVKNMNISSLKGIEYITSLISLDCSNNQLTKLDVSKNTSLTSLDCSNNQLTNLDVSNNKSLVRLDCSHNQLTKLNVSINTGLENLYCGYNQLTKLDVSKNTELKSLSCSENQLTNLSFGKINKLDSLRCNDNQLTTLDISKLTSLSFLTCSYNLLTTLDVSKNTALNTFHCEKNNLTTLDVSKNTELKSLSCGRNQLTTLDVTKNTSITGIFCSNNQLTTLDVSKNTELITLRCGDNPLKTIDVSKNTALKDLYCDNNQLTTLDLSKNINLYHLDCDYNQLTTLDLSKNTALSYIQCDDNKLTSLDLSKNTALKELWCRWNYLSAPPIVGDNVVLQYNPQYSTAKILLQPNDFTGKAGDTATFQIFAEGNERTYQWQTYKSGKWVNSSLPGAKTDKLSVGITASRDGYKFRCVIEDAIGNKVTSKTVSLHLAAPIAITTQPKDYTGVIGSTAKFTVKAAGTDLKYQWQTYTSGKWKNSSLTGSTTATLSVPVTEARDGYKFRCVITDKYNQKATSNSATLHATTPLAITTQPKDYTGAVGSTATFKVKATGTGLKYQWQSYKNGKWVNSSLPGYNTATLSVGVTASRDGYQFRCVITDKYNQTATSNSAVLHVATPAAITSQPKDFTGPIGSTAEFKVKATGTGLKYQWQTYKSGAWKNSSFTGSTTATLSVDVTASRDGYKFRCVITDSFGNTVTSKTATLHVDNTHTSTTNVVTVTTPSNLGLIDADEEQAIPEPEEAVKIVFDTEDSIESVITDAEETEEAINEPDPVENGENTDEFGTTEDNITGITGTTGNLDDALTVIDKEADTDENICQKYNDSDLTGY